MSLHVEWTKYFHVCGDCGHEHVISVHFDALHDLTDSGIDLVSKHNLSNTSEIVVRIKTVYDKMTVNCE